MEPLLVWSRSPSKHEVPRRSTKWNHLRVQIPPFGASLSDASEVRTSVVVRVSTLQEQRAYYEFPKHKETSIWRVLRKEFSTKFAQSALLCIFLCFSDTHRGFKMFFFAKVRCITTSHKSFMCDCVPPLTSTTFLSAVCTCQIQRNMLHLKIFVANLQKSSFLLRGAIVGPGINGYKQQ